VQSTIIGTETKTRFQTLPLVIGITGHRDLPKTDEPRLRECLGEILERIQTKQASTPLLVLSGMAAGADILAAEESFERGIPVLACLPMPVEEYEKDFTPAELTRFRKALPRCWDSIVVGSSEIREKSYGGAGNYIAYYSDLLVAFWDGEPGRGPGGTADIVALRKSGLPNVGRDALISYVPDIGPVYQIVTPREGRPRPANCFDVVETYPQYFSSDKFGKEDFAKAIEHLDRFNRDLSKEPVPVGSDELASLRDRTDNAANRLQKRSLASLRRLYFVAGLAGAAQIIVPSSGLWVLPAGSGLEIKLGLLVVAFAVFALAKRNDYENRYQDYRAVAEGLRVQHAWCCAGLRDRLVEASYLQMQQSELQWIRLALRTAYLISGGRARCAGDSIDHPDCQDWITTQRHYYGNVAGPREAKYNRRAHRAIIAFASVGAALSAIAGILFALAQSKGISIPWHSIHWSIYGSSSQPPWYFPWPQKTANEDLPYWAAMPAALGGMIALLIQFYSQQRGFTENARRYQHMYVVFAVAKERLEKKAGDPVAVLAELGHEALAEHADWLILHRERPLSFVHT